jgi:hypothetical protein
LVPVLAGAAPPLPCIGAAFAGAQPLYEIGFTSLDHRRSERNVTASAE